MDRDPTIQLRQAARAPRWAPDPDGLWQRGLQRRRRRRAAWAAAGASIAILVVLMAVRWAVRPSVGPIASYVEGEVVLTGVSDLVGSGGTVWALQDGRLVRIAPDGGVSGVVPAQAPTCDLRAGTHGWAVAISCDTAAVTLIGPDLSTIPWQADDVGEPVAAGPRPDGSVWAVTTTGVLVTVGEGSESRSIELGSSPAAAAAADGIVWVAVGEPGSGRLVRVEDGTVTYRVPLSAEPQAAVATTGAVWVLADDSVVRVDPQSNRQVAAGAVNDAVEGLADNGHPWAWGAGVATRLDGDVKVRIPADATDVAASADAVFSLVGGDVVRSLLPAD